MKNAPCLCVYIVHLYFIRLLQMEVTSLADVYWFDDNIAARTTFGKDLPRWLQARQTLPTSKENLETLKADLWSAVVKNSQHQDAWTWGRNFRLSLFLFSFLSYVKQNSSWYERALSYTSSWICHGNSNPTKEKNDFKGNETIVI